METRISPLAKSLLLAMLFSGAAIAQTSTTLPATMPATAPVADDEPDQVRLSVGREGEYDAMLDDLHVVGEQRAAFNAKATQRIAELQKFVDSPDGKQLIALREKLAQARRDRRQADIAPLRDQIKPLSDQYWVVRTEGRRELMRLLTEPQLKRYVGYMLELRTVRPIAERAKLTDDQRARARAICDQAAAEWFKMTMVEQDPYFRELAAIEPAVRKRIGSEVLTEDQRASLRPATRPTTRRG